MYRKYLLYSFAALVTTSCTQSKKTEQTATSPDIPVISVLEKDVHLSKNYVADIQAVQYVELRSRVPGFLERIYVDEGRFVKKGQLLFSINDTEYRADVARSKANLNSVIAETRSAELEVEKVTKLVQKRIISETELDVAQAKLRAMRARIEEAEAALRHAKNRLSYTQIRAPFDGVIDRIPLKVGSLLEEGTLITSVTDISSVYAYFNISEGQYLNYLRSREASNENHHAAVSLILADGSHYDLQGRIETIVSEIHESTGSIAFRARFPNPQFLLKHGASGKVQLTNELEDALVLPQKAVFEIQDKNYVFVVDEGNTVKVRGIVPEARINDLYVLESGLLEGERVVYEGIQNIREGMVVTPKIIQLDTAQQITVL